MNGHWCYVVYIKVWWGFDLTSMFESFETVWQNKHLLITMTHGIFKKQARPSFVIFLVILH